MDAYTPVKTSMSKMEKRHAVRNNKLNKLFRRCIILQTRYNSNKTG